MDHELQLRGRRCLQRIALLVMVAGGGRRGSRGSPPRWGRGSHPGSSGSGQLGGVGSLCAEGSLYNDGEEEPLPVLALTNFQRCTIALNSSTIHAGQDESTKVEETGEKKTEQKPKKVSEKHLILKSGHLSLAIGFKLEILTLNSKFYLPIYA